FSTTKGFVYLTVLSLNHSKVEARDLADLKHLPSLQTLSLNETGIGNDSVFSIVKFAPHILHLCIAFNPDISNDVVPALLSLLNLNFLTIVDTSVDMIGIRSLGASMRAESRFIDVEIPHSCVDYLDALKSKYAVNIQRPLIDDPKKVDGLKTAALQRNLAAHGKCNSAILATGTKVEMAKHLKALLEMRKADMLVRELLLVADEIGLC
ncbi:hypothetical protein K438DRAFT_2158438, partial [Mycena galopus ATCC 62051]